MRLPPVPLNPKLLAAYAHDLVMTAAAVFLCYVMRFGVDGVPWVLDEIGILLLIIIPFAAVVYWAFGLYTGIWRFASIPDLMSIVKAVTVITIVMALLDFATRGAIPVPRSVVGAYWFVQCALLGGPRMLYRIYRDGRLLRRPVRGRGTTLPALIAGTGHEAEVVIRSLETSVEPIHPVGLIATKAAHVGQHIRGVRVMGHLDDLENIVRELARNGQAPRRLIVTNETMTREEGIEDFIARARKIGLAAERLSRASLDDAASGRVRLAPIRIEDLLGRSTRELDQELIRTMITGRRVLVTGGGGTVGSELCRQISAMSCKRLMIVEHAEFALYEITRTLHRQSPGVPVDARLCDVRDRRGISKLVESFRPDVVFHAAALKHVPIVERNVAQGILTNTIGTANVADAARKSGARAMILISTDKAVQPISVMGATKRAAECYCEALDTLAFASGNRGDDGQGGTRFISVRFGNVLGSSGSVVPLFQEQLEQGGPITVTHPDMTRYFMTLKEAVSLVLMTSALGLEARDRTSIFVLDMGEPVRIVDLAHRMVRLAGLEPGTDIQVEFIGVREGERLYEELFDSAEPLRPTSLNGILAAESRSVVPDALSRQMKDLARAVADGDEEAMLARLALIVPEYNGSARRSRFDA